VEAKAQRSLGVRLSEGPALRVRIERSCACRDIAFPPGAWRIGPWPKRGNIWVWRDAFLAGVRSPPLRGVDHPRGDGLAGKRPGIALMAIFSEILCWVVKPPWFRESGLPGNETLG
jgi:hypothetical protein